MNSQKQTPGQSAEAAQAIEGKTFDQTFSSRPTASHEAKPGFQRSPQPINTQTSSTVHNEDTAQFYQGGLYNFGPAIRHHIMAGRPHYQGIPQNVDVKPFSGSLKELAAIPSRQTVIRLSATQTEGDLIYSEQVSFLPSSEDIFCNCDVVAAPFNQVRGNFVYTITPAATIYHQCVLYIAYQPIAAAAVPTYKEALGLDGTTYMIHADTPQVIPVPYQYIAPWLKRPRPMGRLLIYVMQPLTFRTDNVAPTIDINIDKHVED